MNLRKYRDIYLQYFKTSFAEATSFRVSFILTMVMDIFFYFSSIFAFKFLYQHVSHIGTWNESQFMFFVGYMIVVDHLHMTFVSQSFWELSFQIKTGQLDYTITKPVDFIFATFFRHIRISSLCNTPVAWGILFYFASFLHFSWVQYIMLPFIVFSSFLIITQTEILLSVLMLFLKEGDGINFLRMQMQQVSRYPDFVFPYAMRVIFTFIFPVLASGSFAMPYFFNQSDAMFILGKMVVINIILYFVIYRVWNWALKYYESASS
jgi:ABC-2 type transport system permease protein